MASADLISTIGLALGIILTLMGVTFAFSSFILASNFEQDDAKRTPARTASIGLLIDFVLVVLDSVPIISLLFAARELPDVAKKMKARWVDEPMIRRFLIAGVILIALGITCFWIASDK
ncbi:MAG: hypothetical protein AAGH89_06515 [Verrucomicrobiota bacterium]